jgi:hypothetical protein
MKNTFKKFFSAFFIVIVFLSVSSISFAQNASSTPDSSTVIELNIQNPIANSVNSIPQFFEKVIDIIIKIAIPFTAIVLVYCGLLFVTARGDSSQLEKARNAFTYAIIGGLVLLSSWLIAQAIKDALTSLTYVF